MYRKLTILLVITNLITVIFLVLQYNENKVVKRDILGQYIMSQHSINSHLNNALEHYHDGNMEGFKDNLYLTSKEFLVVTKILGEGNPIGRHLSIPDSIWTSHWSDMNFINLSYQKALRGELSKEEIEEVNSYSKKMNLITEKLHYEKLISGKSAKQIVEKIEGIRKEIK